MLTLLTKSDFFFSSFTMMKELTLLTPSIGFFFFIAHRKDRKLCLSSSSLQFYAFKSNFDFTFSKPNQAMFIHGFSSSSCYSNITTGVNQNRFCSSGKNTKQRGRRWRRKILS
ncbi:unnamed protein product [Brassica oleracea]|uniref:(rape) hypothetical protein n=1 Tax=Brassica napus TaxID=3708 RepID=A0A816LW60_BRANA|nr:unnamed protein product [Brassica napus]